MKMMYLKKNSIYQQKNVKHHIVILCVCSRILELRNKINNLDVTAITTTATTTTTAYKYAIT